MGLEPMMLTMNRLVWNGFMRLGTVPTAANGCRNIIPSSLSLFILCFLWLTISAQAFSLHTRRGFAEEKFVDDEEQHKADLYCKCWQTIDTLFPRVFRSPS